MRGYIDMARIWMEGFEDGLPNGHNLDAITVNPLTNWDFNGSINDFPQGYTLDSGRNAYSLKSFNIPTTYFLVKYTHTSAVIEGYFRCHFKISTQSTTANRNVFSIGAGSTVLFRLATAAAGTFDIDTNEGGLATRGTLTFTTDTWFQLDVYIKISATEGIFEVRKDNVALYRADAINNGSTGFDTFIWNQNASSASLQSIDDIALNDTTDDGSGNISWWSWRG